MTRTVQLIPSVKPACIPLHCSCSWSDCVKTPMSPKKTLNVTLLAQVYRIFLAIFLEEPVSNFRLNRFLYRGGPNWQILA